MHFAINFLPILYLDCILSGVLSEQKTMCQLILERLRYTGSGLRVWISPFYFSIFADVSIFTRNFYPFSRGKQRPDLIIKCHDLWCVVIVSTVAESLCKITISINRVHLLFSIHVMKH